MKTNAALGTDAGPRALRLLPVGPLRLPGQGLRRQHRDGRVPFFAPGTPAAHDGLVQDYYGFYLANQAELKATVAMTGTRRRPSPRWCRTTSTRPSGPPRALVHASRAAGRLDTPCFDSFRIPDEATRLLGGNSWWLERTPATGWPAIAGGAGDAHPVALLPDTYGGKTLGTVNDHVVPVDYQWTRDGFRIQVPGELTVREVIPADGAAATFEVTGFREEGGSPGKELPLVDGQSYIIRAYATFEDRTGWFPTDREVTVSGGTLGLGFIPLGAGQLGYFVTDLTGEVQESELVTYAPAQ